MSYDLRAKEFEIAKILKEVEAATGSLVEAVTLVDVEVTNIESERPEFARWVNLELKRMPGSRWSTGE